MRQILNYLMEQWFVVKQVHEVKGRAAARMRKWEAHRLSCDRAQSGPVA